MMIKQIFKMIWNHVRLERLDMVGTSGRIRGTVVLGRYVCGTVVFLYPSDGI